MTSGWTIVGVDCATQEEQLGLSRAALAANGVLTVERVTLGTAGESAAASIAQWIAGKKQFVLAFDAPLGWPAPLSAALAGHVAGEPLREAPERLFRRHTDRWLQKQLGKTPPDVGADRIARTARAALLLLAEVRTQSARPIPMAWRQGEESGVIEVYPAATLIARGVSAGGYKAKTAQGRKARAELIERLAKEVEIKAARDLLIEDANLFDAVLCALAGADFARGQCCEPENATLARKEGFIWFRSSGQGSLFPRRGGDSDTPPPGPTTPDK
jgi:predicted nuclease with RNAse H fold